MFTSQKVRPKEYFYINFVLITSQILFLNFIWMTERVSSYSAPSTLVIRAVTCPGRISLTDSQQLLSFRKTFLKGKCKHLYGQCSYDWHCEGWSLISSFTVHTSSGVPLEPRKYQQGVDTRMHILGEQAASSNFLNHLFPSVNFTSQPWQVISGWGKYIQEHFDVVLYIASLCIIKYYDQQLTYGAQHFLPLNFTKFPL